MTAENRSHDGGNVWMIVLIALALIATVIMLFSDSAVWLQIALLAALWAAICGFLLVSRTRHDRDRVRAELDAREREHQAEIEALRARNDADRSALEAARAGEGLPPAVDVEVLREIRAELATLRAQLEDLSGREFGYEPAALQAEARRVKEIEARASRVAPAAEADATAATAATAATGATAVPSQPKEQPSQPAPRPVTPQPQPQPRSEQPRQTQAQEQTPSEPARTPQKAQRAQQKPQPQQAQSAASSRWDSPNSTEETSRITPVRDADENQAINALTKQPLPQQQEQPQAQREAQPQAQREAQPQAQREAQPQAQRRAEGSTRLHGAPSPDAVAGRVGMHRAPEGRNPLTDLIRERQEELERQKREAEKRAEQEQREKAERERRQREEQAELAREEEARRVEAAAQEPGSRGRRRADENREGSLSVAELLARSKKGQ